MWLWRHVLAASFFYLDHKHVFNEMFAVARRLSVPLCGNILRSQSFAFPHFESARIAGLQRPRTSLNNVAKCRKGIISFNFKPNRLPGKKLWQSVLFNMTQCTRVQDVCCWDQRGGTRWLTASRPHATGSAWSWRGVFLWSPPQCLWLGIACYPPWRRALTQTRSAAVTTGVLLLLTDWEHLCWHHSLGEKGWVDGSRVYFKTSEALIQGAVVAPQASVTNIDADFLSRCHWFDYCRAPCAFIQLMEQSGYMLAINQGAKYSVPAI